MSRLLDLTEPFRRLPHPQEFDEGELALDFPSYVWPAQQPLNRVHHVIHDPVHFSVDGDGRFDPPDDNCTFGTCYLSTHPRGAFVEVFGRMSTITPQDIDDRAISKVYLPSDLLLADFTHPAVVGRYGITNELTMGNPRYTYSFTQAWAKILQLLGFSGVLYVARHDVEVVSRSVAYFGKPEAAIDDVSWASEPLAPIAQEMLDHYDFRIAGGRPL